jgi:hypothetical protein
MVTIDDLYREYPDVLPDRSEMRFLDGWARVLAPLLRELSKAGDARLTMAKEKFGEMRIALSPPGDERFRDSVECLRLRSRFVCEQCGKPGRLRKRDDGWMFAACGEHGHDVEPLPLSASRCIRWEGPGDRWRTYEYDERDGQITITWSAEGDKQ